MNSPKIAVDITTAKSGLLDYLVAKLVYPRCAYFDKNDECYIKVWQLDKFNLVKYNPTQKWGHGGPIVEDQNIAIFKNSDIKEDEAFYSYIEEVGDNQEASCCGRTMLESAMRAFVIYKVKKGIIELETKEYLGEFYENVITPVEQEYLDDYNMGYA